MIELFKPLRNNPVFPMKRAKVPLVKTGALAVRQRGITLYRDHYKTILSQSNLITIFNISSSFCITSKFVTGKRTELAPQESGSI